MGRLFYIMGKSASGKDKIFEKLLAEPSLGLKRLVLYTTRPIRINEKEGRDYHFTDEAGLDAFRRAGRVIEERTYQTVEGPWTYATIADTDDWPGEGNYLSIGTLVSYRRLCDYLGEDKVVPLYIESGDYNRLTRSIRREAKQVKPDYREVCRRFLADSEDFSETHIKEAGITRRFVNDGELEDCLREVEEAVRNMLL